MVDRIIQTTATVEAEKRFDFWKRHVLPGVDVTPVADRLRFNAARHVLATTQGMLVDTQSSPISVERLPGHIGRDGVDHICIATLTDGHGVQRQAGRDIQLRAGDIAISDVGRSFVQTAFAGYRELRLYVPRRSFVARVGPVEGMAGLGFARGTPLVDMLTGYLATFATTQSGMSVLEADLAMDGLLHLLGNLAALQHRRPIDGGEQVSFQAILVMADRYIGDNLNDGRLDASSLVRALGVSRTRLYLAFADRGGIRAAIRDARLDRVRLILANPDKGMSSIEEIARRTGFEDYPTFSRSFRRRFGCTPREIREG